MTDKLFGRVHPLGTLTGERRTKYVRQFMINLALALAGALALMIGDSVYSIHKQSWYGLVLWLIILGVAVGRLTYLLVTHQTLFQLRMAERQASKQALSESYKDLQNLADSLQAKHGK
jgi:hypothetical protein